METLIIEDRYSHYDFEIQAYPDDDYLDTKIIRWSETDSCDLSPASQYIGEIQFL